MVKSKSKFPSNPPIAPTGGVVAVVVVGGQLPEVVPEQQFVSRDPLHGGQHVVLQGEVAARLQLLPNTTLQQMKLKKN